MVIGGRLNTVLTVVLLSGLTRVVRVVLPNTVNSVRSIGVVGIGTLFLCQLTVLHHGSIFAETLLSASVSGPQVYNVSQEVRSRRNAIAHSHTAAAETTLSQRLLPG